MSTERDDLISVLVNLPWHSKTAGYAADAILAAGWSRPRVVSSMDEVASLPVGSVVLDAFGATCTKTGAGLLGWRRVTTAVASGAGHWHAPYVPLTVLFEGSA